MRPREAAAHLWVSSTGLSPSFQMLEQSKALPSYRSVITLLWIQDGESAS